MKTKLFGLCLILVLVVSCDFNTPYKSTVKVSAKYPQTSDSTLMIKVNGEYLFEYYMGSAVNGTIEVSVPLDQYVTFEWREYMYGADFVVDSPWLVASITKIISQEDTGTEIVIDPIRIDPDEHYPATANFYDLLATGTISPFTITNGPRGFIEKYYEDSNGESYYTTISAGASNIDFSTTVASSATRTARWTLYEDGNPTVTSYYIYGVTN